MSARKSPSFSRPSPSNPRFPLGRIPASGPEGRKSAAHAEDGSFQPAADFRLSICEIPPTVVAPHHAGQGPKRSGDRFCQKFYERP